MDLLYVFFTTIGSIIALFLLTKMIGCRQVSQMSMFDYINGITIGSIAAEMATALETDWKQPLLAMVIYAVVGSLLSIISSKSLTLSRFIEGKPVILYNEGEIFFKHLKKTKVDIGELLMQCRIAGYFDLSEIQTIVLEDNGHFSILPKAQHRPLTPTDMKITPPVEHLVANVIIDGNILKDNLKYLGKNETWLHQQLKANDISDVKDVFLATIDYHQKFCVYKKYKNDIKPDILE